MRRMIDLGVAIKEIDKFSRWGVSGQEMPIIDSVCQILNSLPRTLVDDRPNDPLTLEELRGMSGEPVWVSSRKINRYDICCGSTTDDLVQFCKLALPGWDYGKTWIAYRRKPDKESNSKTIPDSKPSATTVYKREEQSMYSSNQHMDITCGFEQFPFVLDFIIHLSGRYDCLTRSRQRVKLAFQITKDGLYLLKLGSMPSDPNRSGSFGIACQEGWTDYPFDYDPEIIAQIIQQWVQAQPNIESDPTDGVAERGIWIRHPNQLSEEKLWDLERNQHISMLHVLAVCQPIMLTYDK